MLKTLAFCLEREPLVRLINYTPKLFDEVARPFYMEVSPRGLPAMEAELYQGAGWWGSQWRPLDPPRHPTST